MKVELREVEDADLDVFFEHMQDAEALWMAGFTPEDPADRGAFDSHWAKMRAHPEVWVRSIVADGDVAGHIATFFRDESREVTYWVGRDHWGRGIATAALRRALEEVGEAGLEARVVKDNLGSCRVLQKCGFVVRGEDRGVAAGRGGEEVEEWVMAWMGPVLDSADGP